MSKRDSVASAIAYLRATGVRVTPPRRQVIETLARLTGPRPADEIYRRLRGPRPHRATVYRIVQALEEAGVLKRIHFDRHEAERYELSDAVTLHHHHHVVCESCGEAKAVACAAATRPRVPGFTVLRHQLEWYGLCRSCARTA